MKLTATERLGGKLCQRGCGHVFVPGKYDEQATHRCYYASETDDEPEEDDDAPTFTKVSLQVFNALVVHGEFSRGDAGGWE